MTNCLRLQIGLVLGFGLCTGCARDPIEIQAASAEPAPPVEQAVPSPVEQRIPIEASSKVARADENSTDVGNGIWITVPARLRFPGVANVEAAPSWDARVAGFSQADQVYLSEVSDRYFGTMEFLDEAEQRQLIRQGFPMPEEWLAAHNLPTVELERLVEEGNMKATMFYIDRVSQEMGARRARGEGLGSTPEDRALGSRFVRARGMADDLLRTSRSPFAAYLSGRIATAGTFGNPPEMFAGAFEMAKDLGHERAGMFQGRFFAAHPGMRAQGVMISYTSLKQALAR